MFRTSHYHREQIDVDIPAQRFGLRSFWTGER